MELTIKTHICMTFYTHGLIGLSEQHHKMYFSILYKRKRGMKGSRSLLVNELVAVLRPAESRVLALSHRTASTYPPNPLRA